MFSKIVTIVAISLSTLCAGELSPNMYRSPTNQAVSSMHFHRDDVPLDYKYSAIHTHSSPNPTGGYRDHLKYHSSSADPINFRSIQYAPLLRPGELRLQNGMYSKVPLHSPHDFINPTSVTKEQTSTKRDRKPLEPRLESKPTVVHPHPLSHLEYIPGHNIEVLRSVNRSPGHNAVYRSYADGNSPAEKLKKVNYLNQYIIYQPNPLDVEVITKNQQKWPSSSTETPSTTVINTTPTTFRPSKKSYISNQYYAQKSNPYHIKELTKQQQKAPYTKMHALLLNVARAYNMALTPHKSLHAGANPALLVKQNPSQKLMKVPGSLQLVAPSSDKKTLMYPVQKNLHFAIQS